MYLRTRKIGPKRKLRNINYPGRTSRVGVGTCWIDCWYAVRSSGHGGFFNRFIELMYACFKDKPGSSNFWNNRDLTGYWRTYWKYRQRQCDRICTALIEYDRTKKEVWIDPYGKVIRAKVTPPPIPPIDTWGSL